MVVKNFKEIIMLKNFKTVISVVMSIIVLISMIRPVLAVNQYAVCEGSPTQFIIFLRFMHLYYYFYYFSPIYAFIWATDIIDTVGAFPVYVYYISENEIEDETKPSLQSLSDNTWIDVTETTPNNFTIVGSASDTSNTFVYTGKIEFNKDKVLKYVYDELKIYDNGMNLIEEERFIWTLTTYTEGTGMCGGDHQENDGDDGVPGFPSYATIIAILIGFIFILKKKNILIKKE